MANTLTYAVKQHWAKQFQASLEESLVVMDLAKMRFQDMTKGGTTINIPRLARHGIAAYTKYTTPTAQDVTTANDTLVMDQIPFIKFSYDKVDGLENYLDVVSEQLSRDVFTMKRYIEGKFFNQSTNALFSNGTAQTISKTVTDAAYAGNVFGIANATLVNEGCDPSRLALVVDAFTLNTIGISSIGNSFTVADETIKRGYKGQFMGFDVYVSNNLTFTATLDLATQPALNDTVKINGVTLTFVTTIGATAGNVLRGADAAASMTNLISAINGTAGGGTTYIDIAQEDRNDKLSGISAAQGTNQVLLTSIHGYRPVSTPTMTTAANDWKDAVLSCLAMEKGAIDMAMQKEVSVEERDQPGNLVTDYMVWSKFGLKVTTEGAKRMYVVKVVSQADET